MTSMTDELFEDLIDDIVGGSTIAAWCRIVGHPSKKTVAKWVSEDKNRRTRLDGALEVGAIVMVDDSVDIVDEDPENGQARANVRLRVAAIRNAKMREKQQVQLSNDPENPVSTHLTFEAALTELARLYTLAQARAAAAAADLSPATKELLS